MSPIEKKTLEKIQKSGIPANKILHTCNILHEGWDTDNQGWIVELENGKVLGVTTNHNKIEVWEPKTILQNLSETINSAKTLTTALTLLLLRESHPNPK